MTEYDFKMHIPQQIENLLQAYASGDPAALERVKNNVEVIVNDEVFKKDLKDFDSERASQLDNIERTALEGLKTISNAKNVPIAEQNLLEIKNKYMVDLNTVESEYWENVKEYIVGYVKENYE